MSSPAREIEKLRGRFGDAILDAVYYRGEDTVVVDSTRIRDVCRFLKEDPELDFSMLTDITGIHFLERAYSYEVIYHLLSLNRRRRLRLKARLGEEGEIDSVVEVWSTANWHEREAFDLIGIRFREHPDPRRILMPDGYDGHPLRRDHPLER